MSMSSETYRSGFIAIVGRPNVGKSTLTNALVGQKISITTHKPQTTRHQILGIKTSDDWQMLFVDTPGFHLGQNKAINQYMNKAALAALQDVDLVLMVLQAGTWTDEDQALLKKLSNVAAPVIAVVNKVDLVPDKTKLLPYLENLNSEYAFATLVPLSAAKRQGIDVLQQEIVERLPLGHPYYDEEQITDKSLRFLAAERIREKLFLTLHDELPYALTVEIEEFVEEAKINRISAVIWVEKPGHKGIVIGKKGENLKLVGRMARESMEGLFDKKVFLQLWVKVKAGWSDDERALQSLGYFDANDK